MLETFTTATFEPHVGTTFLVHGATAEPLTLTLTHLTRGRPGNSLATREAFSLFFRGPRDTYLQQSMYLFEHEALGTFEIFIVPVGQDATGYQYEAVFT
jgi:hypothetical protein